MPKRQRADPSPSEPLKMSHKDPTTNDEEVIYASQEEMEDEEEEVKAGFVSLDFNLEFDVIID